MALVLSLRSGQDFYVGDLQIVVGRILGDAQFEVIVPSTGRRYEVSDEQSTELREAPDVFLSAGDRPQVGIARIAIDAPRAIAILRGESMRHGPKEATVEFKPSVEFKPRGRHS